MAENNNTTRFDGVIDLSGLRKKRFTIDGDESKILELNTSDLSIVSRLSESYPKLKELGESLGQISNKVESTDESVVADLSTVATLKNVDEEMRKLLDYIFDSNVSEMCAPSGSMYDPIGGKLRYEHILTILAGLYEENLAKEMKRVQSRVKTHTDKYTG